MAKKAKQRGKGEATDAFASAQQAIAKFTSELSKLTVSLSPMTDKLEKSVGKLRGLTEAVEGGEKRVKAFIEANSRLASEQEKSANATGRQTTATQGFIGVLAKMELSFRRIEGGFNRIKNALTFADESAIATNNFMNMAQAIGVSAEEMKKLQYATMKLGADSDEATGMYRELMTDMANMRMGQGGGRLEKLIKVWGLNATGMESPTEMLSKIQQKYLSLDGFRRIAFQRDAGFSDNLANMFLKFTPDEFVKKIKEENAGKLSNGQAGETKKAAEGVVEAKASAEIAKELEGVSAMVNYGDWSEKTYGVIKDIFDYMDKNPWVRGVKVAAETGGAIASTAVSAASMITIMKQMKALKGVKDAAALGRGLSATAGVTAGMGVMGTLGIIASAVLVVAGGWWAVTKISELIDAHYKNIKKPEDALSEKQSKVSDAKEGLAREKEYGSAKAIERAEKKLQKEEARLAEAQRFFVSVPKILGKIDRGEYVSEQEYGELNEALELDEWKKELGEKFGTALKTTNASLFSAVGNAKELRLFNKMRTGAYGDTLSLIGQFDATQKNIGGRKVGGNIDLFKEFVKSGMADKASPAEQKMIADYMETHIGSYLLDDFIRWAETNPEWKGKVPKFMLNAAYVGRTGLDTVPYLEEDMRRIENFMDDATLNMSPSNASNVFEAERLRKEQDRVRKQRSPIVFLSGLAEHMGGWFSKVEEVGVAADEANIPPTVGGGEGTSTTVNEGSPNISVDKHDQTILNVHVGSASDVATAIGQAKSGAERFAADSDDRFFVKLNEVIAATVPSLRSSQVA